MVLQKWFVVGEVVETLQSHVSEHPATDGDKYQTGNLEHTLDLDMENLNLSEPTAASLPSVQICI